LVRRGARRGRPLARGPSKESAFAAGLKRIRSEIRATSKFMVRISGDPMPVPSRTPPCERSIIRLRTVLPRAAGLVRRPRISASPNASSPNRWTCAKSSALGTTVLCIKL
jgi:hypothetical protein